jgi:hypothetical protein
MISKASVPFSEGVPTRRFRTPEEVNCVFNSGISIGRACPRTAPGVVPMINAAMMGYVIA